MITLSRLFHDTRQALALVTYHYSHLAQMALGGAR